MYVVPWSCKYVLIGTTKTKKLVHIVLAIVVYTHNPGYGNVPTWGHIGTYTFKNMVTESVIINILRSVQ